MGYTLETKYRNLVSFVTFTFTDWKPWKACKFIWWTLALQESRTSWSDMAHHPRILIWCVLNQVTLGDSKLYCPLGSLWYILKKFLNFSTDPVCLLRMERHSTHAPVQFPLQSHRYKCTSLVLELQPPCRFSLAAIFILEKKKTELELHKKSKLDGPYNS